MASHGSPLWTDRSWLRDVQYRTEANLAAGQSLYAYQHPRLNLPACLALGLAALTGTETIADAGCGNGIYLAELARRELRRDRDGTIRVRTNTGCLIGR